MDPPIRDGVHSASLFSAHLRIQAEDPGHLWGAQPARHARRPGRHRWCCDCCLGNQKCLRKGVIVSCSVVWERFGDVHTSWRWVLVCLSGWKTSSPTLQTEASMHPSRVASRRFLWPSHWASLWWEASSWVSGSGCPTFRRSAGLSLTAAAYFLSWLLFIKCIRLLWYLNSQYFNLRTLEVPLVLCWYFHQTPKNKKQLFETVTDKSWFSLEQLEF